MARFRKKPVEVDAVLYTGSNTDQIVEFAGEQCKTLPQARAPILINTLEGSMLAQPGDWIIKGVKGEFYPCKPDIFAETYEASDGR